MSLLVKFQIPTIVVSFTIVVAAIQGNLRTSQKALPEDGHSKQTQSLESKDADSHPSSEPALTQDLEPKEDFSRVNWSDLLGLRNLGSNDYANSVYKMLLFHPRILEFTSDNTPLKSLDHSHTELHSRQEIRKSLHGLFSRLKQQLENIHRGEESFFAHTGFYETDLRSIFAKAGEYLKVKNPNWRPLFKITGEKAPDYLPPSYMCYLDQCRLDTYEYLQELLNLMGYTEYFGGFKEVSKFQVDPRFRSILFVPISEHTAGTLQDVVNDYLVAGDKELAYRESAPNQIFIRLNRFRQTGRNFQPDRLDTPVQLSPRLNLNFYSYSEKNRDFLLHPMGAEMELRSVIVTTGGPTARSSRSVTYTFNSQKNYWLKHDQETVTFLSGSLLDEAFQDMIHHGYLFLYVKSERVVS